MATDAKGLALEVPPELTSRRLFGATLLGINSLREAPSIGTGRVESLGWLALTLSSGEALVLGGGTVETAKGSRNVEVVVPLLSLETNLPEVPRWPGGPALPWIRVPSLESDLLGRELLGFRVISETSYDLPTHDVAIAFIFSGGWSLMVEASESAPTTVDVWKFPNATRAGDARV